MQTKHYFPLMWALTALSIHPPAAAQGPSQPNAANPTQVLASCQHDVAKFEQSVTLVRQTLGTKAATELREKLLSSRETEEATAQDGPCGVARLLRSRKLI